MHVELPPDVDEALRQIAFQEKRHLKDVVPEVLREGLAARAGREVSMAELDALTRYFEVGVTRLRGVVRG